MGVVPHRRLGRNQYSQQSEGIFRRHRPDYILLLLTVALLAVGIVVIFSIGPALEVEKGLTSNHYVTRQLIAIGLGAIMFGVASTLPLSHWRKLYMPLLILAGIATLIALILPVNVDYPAHRWIRVGSLSFQSVELLKFALVLGLAAFFGKQMSGKEGANNAGKVFKFLMAGIVTAGVVVAWLQSDFGSFAVIVVMAGFMAYVAGMPMRHIGVAAGVIGVLGSIFVLSTPYRLERVTAFLHPEKDCTTSGYQACQALIAVGSGGMVGLGLGRSVQAYGYLPEAENDSIFAIYAEKFGFLGTAALLGLFAAVFTRIKKIAERAPDNFSRLAVVGILVWLSTQAIINIGAMIGMLPLKGITLPLISYGGSSVLLTMAALGLVFQVSRYTLYNVPEADGMGKGGGRNEDNRDRRRIRGAYHPAPGRRI